MEVKDVQLEPIPRPINGVKEQDEIFLSIEIGNGQIGGNRVSSNDMLLASGNLTQPTFIGKAIDLMVHDVDIRTSILDVVSFTNACVIITTFRNQGNKILFSKIDKDVAPEDGIINFLASYSLKIVPVLLLLFFGLSLNLTAQGGNVEFENLETPSSPGFILLDQTPSSIEKPTTPQGLGLSLLGIQKNGGALEFAPFWLTVHPKLTAEKMYKNVFPFLYHLAISGGSVKTDNSNYLTSGIRTRVIQVYGTKSINTLDSLKVEIENALSEAVLDLVKIGNLREAYTEIINEKPVFTFDIAGAIGGGSSSNTFHDLNLNRWAIWGSLTLKPQTNGLYLTALSRYIRNKEFESYSDNSDLVDIGARLNYDLSKFCLSVEYLHRLNLTEEVNDDFRIAAVGSYKINENLYVTSTFGKNFTEVNNIIALAGVNFGFSKSEMRAF